MTQHRPGTIAALQYSQRPPLDFTDIVEEFDIAFQDDSISRRRLTWDCDDVAIFDRETVRVALGWMPPESEDQPWHLIVAVGTSPDAADTPITREFCEDMAAHILERTSEYLPYDAVLRSEADGAIDAEMIDTIAGQIQRAGRDMQEPRTAAPEEGAPPSEGRYRKRRRRRRRPVLGATACAGISAPPPPRARRPSSARPPGSRPRASTFARRPRIRRRTAEVTAPRRGGCASLVFGRAPSRGRRDQRADAPLHLCARGDHAAAGAARGGGAARLHGPARGPAARRGDETPPT